MSAYKLADEKIDEEGKTVLLSIFFLQKHGSVSEGARFHAMLYGPGQAAEVIIHKRGAAVKRDIVKKFVTFLMERGVQTANWRKASIPGKEGVSVPNIKRLERKQPLNDKVHILHTYA
jgi:hypothetical protein